MLVVFQRLGLLGLALVDLEMDISILASSVGERVVNRRCRSTLVPFFLASNWAFSFSLNECLDSSVCAPKGSDVDVDIDIDGVGAVGAAGIWWRLKITHSQKSERSKLWGSMARNNLRTSSINGV